MYKSYRMGNTEQVATVGPQTPLEMVVEIRYRNEVAAATTLTAPSLRVSVGRNC